MARRLDFTKYDKDDPGAPVSPELANELRRLANLFLVSGITLVLLLVQVLALTLSVTFIPGPVKVTSGVVFLTGLAATYVYGIFVTSRARRWGWFALCVIPATSAPCSAKAGLQPAARSAAGARPGADPAPARASGLPGRPRPPCPARVVLS